MATLSRFASPSYRRPQGNSTGGYGSPFGWSGDLGQNYQSGRAYWSPDRMSERYDRAKLRAMENQAAGGRGGGGGSRGSGGYGGGQMGPPMAQPPIQWTPEVVADQMLSNYGNSPGMGMDYAGALARLQSGGAQMGDFNLLQQRNNPSVPGEVNAAKARQQWRALARQGYGTGGLVGAAQQALFG